MCRGLLPRHLWHPVASWQVAYTATGSESMMDLLRHFFSRGHDGRVTCVDASAAADFVVSGGVDYTVRTGPADDTLGRHGISWATFGAVWLRI
jgi:WD40 repeat protein